MLLFFLQGKGSRNQDHKDSVRIPEPRVAKADGRTGSLQPHHERGELGGEQSE